PATIRLSAPRRPRSRKSSRRTATPRPGSARSTTRRTSSTRWRGPSTNGRWGWGSSTSTGSWAARPIRGPLTCSNNQPTPSRSFYGLRGGETDRWQPSLSKDQPQISPWMGKPGYNLTTDMADEAIKYVKDLNAAAPDKPFFLYYVPGGTHAPHQPTPEWIEKF